MNEMLDNSNDGVQSLETIESPADVNVSEENTAVDSSVNEEINNTDVNPESQEGENVEETTEKTEGEESAKVEETAEAVIQKPRPTRAQRRIRKILADKKRLEEKLAKQESVELKRNETGEVELTPDQLNEFISSQVQETIAKQKDIELAEEKAALWDDDIHELMQNNPELDPESNNFNPELSTALIELIEATNTDDYGEPSLRKLPSEVYSTIQSTLSAAKSVGKKEAASNITEVVNNSAVQNVVSEPKDKTYSDQELSKLQKQNPARYTELIEQGIV